MWLLWISLVLGSDKKQSIQETQKQSDCSVFPSDTELVELSRAYYERQGIWAGIFRLDSAENYQTEKFEGSIRFHLRYRYRPIPNNPLGREDAGVDQRIFTLKCKDGWRVDDMGSFMSAEFK